MSQNYPVTCTPIVKPSYTLKWSEISTSTDMFKVHLLLKDLTKPSVDVYLKIRLSGVGVDIRTIDGFIPNQTLTLIPGQPRMLTASDLAEYFNISNLVVDGVDISALYNGGRLPEGLYTWTVEAYEVDRNRQVSNTGMALMNVFKNYPPIINIPQDGAILPVTTPQNVLFSWTSRSTASLNAAQGKTYKLRIYPLSGDDDPNVVANSGIQPIEITTTNPYFNYGAGNIPLEKGKRYAVQVQELDDTNADDYENEGKSQVVTFSYGKPCVAPEGMVINPIGKGRVELTCEATAEDAETYPITAWYKTTKTSIWNSVPFNGNSAVISGLKDKTDYEFKLSSACGDNTNTMAALREGDILPSGDPSTEPEIFKIDDSEFDEEDPEMIDPAILDPYTIGVEINTDGTTRPVETLDGIFNKIIKPECVTNADAYAECSPTHPFVDLPPVDAEDLRSLNVGDVLGIYDYAVLVTAIGGGNTLSGKGLVKLPFLDNSFMAVEFSGIKAKKGEAGTQGGCVYEVGDYFRTRPISQTDLQNEQVRTIADIIKLTEPTVFHGDLEVAIKKYQEKGSEIATKGTVTPQEKQDLLTYTKGVEVAIGTWKDKFSEVFGSGETDPKIAEIIGDMTAILTQLNADKQTIEGGTPPAGTSYPTIPDLKAKVDAIIEKIKALHQENTPKPPRIQNVIVADIGTNQSTIVWEGDPRFTKYVISYKTPNGGELIETVDSKNSLYLKKLQENSNYEFKIDAYIGSKLGDTYLNGKFSTLKNILPKPENVKIVQLDKNSLKLSWDKNKLHESYRLVYRDKVGLEKFIPIGNRNTITLEDLDSEQLYDYELVAVGNNLTSDATLGNFNTCKAIARVLYYDRTQLKNIWTTNPISIISGDGITLQLTGCSGSVTWKSSTTDINESSPTFCPSKSSVYVGICGNDGCQSDPITVNVTQPECTTETKLTTPSNIVKKGDKVLLLSSCPYNATGSLSFINANGNFGSAYSDMAINGKTTFILSCTTQYGGFCGYNTTYTKTCKSEVTVDVYLPCENYFGVPFSVSSSKTNNINIGEEITLKATGCPTTVNWNNGKTGTIITIKPTETLTYVALCSRTPLTPCGDVVKLNVNPFKILAQPLKNSYKIAENITLTAQGCGDIVKWSTGEEGNFIVVQPVTNVTYEAVCMDKKATQNIKIDKFLAPEIVCEDFKPKATPTTIFKGESNTVKLIGDGCTNGKVIWKNKSTGTIISNLSPTDASIILSNATTFIATCNKVGFSPSVIEVPINATLRNFQLTASKTQIPYGKTQPVILTTSGCIGGSVFWSDGEAQGQAVRTVNVSPPKTFQATCKGEDFEATKTVTINVQLTGSGAVLAGTQGTCPKNFGINFYKNATDKKPYYGFPVVKPGQEIRLEVVGCSTTPIWSWDDQYSINTSIKTKQNDRVTYYTVKCGSTCSAFIGVTAFDCEGWQNTTKEESWPVNDIIDLVPNVSCPVTVSWYKKEGTGFNYYGIEENERGGIGVRVTNTITTYKAICSIDGVDCSLSYTIKPKINATNDAPSETPVAGGRVAYATTSTCSETKIQLKQAMAGYIAGLLCADINLLKDKEGKISAEKVAQFLPKLESGLKTVATYQLPANKEAIINAIVNGNSDECDFGNAAELLASTFEGDILISDYKEKTKTSPEVNDKLLQDYLGKKYIIDLPDPDTKTTTKNYKIGNYLVSFYVDVVRNTAGNYIINGKEYKPLVYDGSNGFAGFYDINILPSIKKDENGKYLTDDLNAKGGWLLPASQFYEFKPYQPFLENTLAELQPNFLDSFESYWNTLHKCTTTQLRAYDNGIVPECFWKGVGNPNFAQLAGVIDETYRTGVNFGQFGKFVMPLSNIDDLLRDYLLGITCEDELWDNIKKIDKLEDEIRKLDYDSELINFVVDKWKNEQIETLAEDINACEEYIKFKKKVPIYADIVLNWDKWASGFDALHANIDKYVETFAKDLGNVGTLNDLQNYAIGKRMFEVGSIFATAGGASPAEVGVNTLKKLPKLPKNIPLRAIEHTATEVKVIAEGQTTSLFTVSKEGVYTSERWFTGTGVTTKLDEVTNVHFMERGSSFKTGTIEFVEDASGNKWLKASTTASRYANYPNIQKLATHVLDEVDNLADDFLVKLESDLTGNIELKTAFESEADLVDVWKLIKEPNAELVKKVGKIIKTRKTNPTERIKELGKDLDKGEESIIEGEAGFEIEERYGYFERYKAIDNTTKGDWVSLSGPYRGKTFDETGGGIAEMAISEFARKPSQKRKFFESLDIHFIKSDYVVLNLTNMKRLEPTLYTETMDYIINKFGTNKLINITK
ncbi:fibronectin type III domain-containing protein [Emticicia oligotrophica]|nr:fibronectin type III domain-containing protein [Emticicia oligotrophica]